MVLDQRANPVLFDQITFPDLLELEGDVGGRGIFSKHKVTYLPWHDDALLLDVDTPEHYQRLKDLTGMIIALILAAGQSKRMGQPKMLLPWGEVTVLEQVIATFRAAGVEDILVITGGARQPIEALVGISARTVFNPDYAGVKC